MAGKRSANKHKPKGRANPMDARTGAATQVRCDACDGHMVVDEGTGAYVGMRVLRCERLGCRHRQQPVPAAVEVALAGGEVLPGIQEEALPAVQPAAEEVDAMATTTASPTPAGAADPETVTAGRSARNGAGKREPKTSRTARLMARAEAPTSTMAPNDIDEQNGALPPGEAEIRAAEASGVTAPEIRMIPLDEIAPHALNPRKRFDEAALQELADSIREEGVRQPIEVRSAGDVPPGVARFWIVMGERRWRASKLAGLTHIPAIVGDVADDARHLRLALLENLIRQDLDPMEEARGYALLRDRFGMTQVEIGEQIGRNRATIANAIRLVEGLPEDVQTLISAGQLSPSHGRALLRFAAYPKVVSLVAELAAEHGTPSKELEAKLPFTERLRSAKLAQEIPQGYYGRDQPFDTKLCDSCPFGAMAVGGYNGQKWCLKPSHMQQLKRDAKAKREEAAEHAKAMALANGPASGPLDLTMVREGEGYVEIRGKCAGGGDGVCPCFARATIKPFGYAHEANVCTDPPRIKALIRLEVERAEAERRNREETVTAQLRARMARMDRSDQTDRPALALLVAKLILSVEGYRRVGDLRPLVEPYSPAAAAAITGGCGGGDPSDGVALVTELAHLAADQLVRLALEIVLRPAISQIVGFPQDASATRGLLTWYLPEAFPKSEPAPPKSLHHDDTVLDSPDAEPNLLDGLAFPQQIEQSCVVCGGPVSVDSANELRDVAAAIEQAREDNEQPAVFCDQCGMADLQLDSPELAVMAGG